MSKCWKSKYGMGSAEALASSLQAVGSDVAFLVEGGHRLVALVTWHLHLVVLDNVLLDDGLSCAKSARLTDCMRVEICLGDETIVTWNVRRSLRCTDSKLVMLIALRLAIGRQLIARVMTVRAERHLELSLEVATLRCVRLARV